MRVSHLEGYNTRLLKRGLTPRSDGYWYDKDVKTHLRFISAVHSDRYTQAIYVAISTSGNFPFKTEQPDWKDLLINIEKRFNKVTLLRNKKLEALKKVLTYYKNTLDVREGDLIGVAQKGIAKSFILYYRGEFVDQPYSENLYKDKLSSNSVSFVFQDNKIAQEIFHILIRSRELYNRAYVFKEIFTYLINRYFSNNSNTVCFTSTICLDLNNRSYWLENSGNHYYCLSSVEPSYIKL